MGIGRFVVCCGGVIRRQQQLEQMGKLFADIGEGDEGVDNQGTENELGVEAVNGDVQRNRTCFPTVYFLSPWRHKSKGNEKQHHLHQQKVETSVVKNDLNSSIE